MKKLSKDDKLNICKARIDLAHRIMKEEKAETWEKCRDFFEGRHWPKDSPDKLKTINLIWSTVRTKLAAQYFRNPDFTLKPKKADFEGPLRRLNEAVLRYHAKKAMLKAVARSCVLSTFTDLAIIHWGCDTKFIKGKTERDSFYFKQIQPECFYVDHASGEQVFQKLPWFAAHEWMRVEEVAEKFGVPEKKISTNKSLIDAEDEREKYRNGEGYVTNEVAKDFERVKVYRMYDREDNKIYVWGEGHDFFFDEADYNPSDGEPYAVLKFDERRKGFYPSPEIEHLRTPQKEIEIAASMHSEHMKRSARKILIQENMLDDCELSKLEDPSAGAIIIVKGNVNGIKDLGLGSVDSSIYNHSSMYGNYFDQIAGVNITRRGGDSKKLTATAEAIIDKYQMNRSSDRMSLLSDFMEIVGNGFLNCIQENLTLPGVIQIADEQDAMMWVSYIPTLDIRGDFECSVKVGETAPKDDALERAQWLECLKALQANPLIMMSKMLIEETLQRFNIENPALIDEMVKLGQVMMQQQAMGIMGQGSTGGPAPTNRGQMVGANLRA